MKSWWRFWRGLPRIVPSLLWALPPFHLKIGYSVSIVDSGSVQETATDEFGYFSFENVSSGDHTLKVDHMDYESVILPGVQVGSESGDQALNTTVQLKEKGESHSYTTMEDLIFQVVTKLKFGISPRVEIVTSNPKKKVQTRSHYQKG